MTTPRTPTAIDALAERYLDADAALNPILATYYGVAGHDHELPAYDPDWHAEASTLRRRTLAELSTIEPADSVDRVTVSALRDSLELAEQLRDVGPGTDEADLNNIASPLQGLRDVFDITPTNTVDDWDVVRHRLAALPASLAGYTESLRFAARHGRIPPRRQIEVGMKQSARISADTGFFAEFTAAPKTREGEPVPDSLQAELAAAGAAAAAAYARIGEVLRDELLGQAPEQDAAGREIYPLRSRGHVGARIDIDETYAWGQAELARITAEMVATADRIKPGASVAEAIAFLDEDETRTLHGTDALQRWMQETSDTALAALAGTHFDIPQQIRNLECRIAPTHEGGIYYTGPSEDLVTRPGRMWWSVPDGITTFAPWRERTTVYHEGVPGHHLQVAQTVYRKDLLNRWRRLACWTSGHGEGWALYAERLMSDLGFLDDPADYLGMLDGQSLRAARVVLDIGFHCGLAAPAEVGGGEWTYDKAWTFLRSHCNMNDGFLRFELDRYLGWPGQAPAYKIGERLWMQLREEARAQDGADFDLARFHRRALDVGSVGLDVLRSAVLGRI